jgi:hypothetical protein
LREERRTTLARAKANAVLAQKRYIIFLVENRKLQSSRQIAKSNKGALFNKLLKNIMMFFYHPLFFTPPTVSATGEKSAALISPQTRRKKNVFRAAFAVCISVCFCIFAFPYKQNLR